MVIRVTTQQLSPLTFNGHKDEMMPHALLDPAPEINKPKMKHEAFQLTSETSRLSTLSAQTTVSIRKPESKHDMRTFPTPRMGSNVNERYHGLNLPA